MTQEEFEESKRIERVARHEAAIKSRADWTEKSSRIGRKRIALELLQKQLKAEEKPAKGIKPLLHDSEGNIEYETLKDGTQRAVRMQIVSLDAYGIQRIKKQIFSLQRKLA